eukprot:RCo008672
MACVFGVVLAFVTLLSGVHSGPDGHTFDLPLGIPVFGEVSQAVPAMVRTVRLTPAQAKRSSVVIALTVFSGRAHAVIRDASAPITERTESDEHGLIVLPKDDTASSRRRLRVEVRCLGSSAAAEFSLLAYLPEDTHRPSVQLSLGQPQAVLCRSSMGLPVRLLGPGHTLSVLPAAALLSATLH